jgi:hypothetical protein
MLEPLCVGHAANGAPGARAATANMVQPLGGKGSRPWLSFSRILPSGRTDDQFAVLACSKASTGLGPVYGCDPGVSLADDTPRAPERFLQNGAPLNRRLLPRPLARLRHRKDGHRRGAAPSSQAPAAQCAAGTAPLFAVNSNRLLQQNLDGREVRSTVWPLPFLLGRALRV